MVRVMCPACTKLAYWSEGTTEARRQVNDLLDVLARAVVINPDNFKEPNKRTGNGDKSPIGSTSEFKKKFGDTINQMAKELGVDPNLLAAVILVESGGSGFVDGNLKIRFENHYFLDRTKGYTDLFTVEQHFNIVLNSKLKYQQNE